MLAFERHNGPEPVPLNFFANKENPPTWQKKEPSINELKSAPFSTFRQKNIHIEWQTSDFSSPRRAGRKPLSEKTR